MLLRAVVIAVLVIFELFGTSSWAQGAKPAAPISSVKVVENIVRIVRQGHPERASGAESREFRLRFPSVEDAGPNSREIDQALVPDALFSNSAADSLVRDFAYESGCLSELDYKVLFNRLSLLQIEYTLDTLCAYPDQHSRRRLVDLRSGQVLLAKHLFKAASLPAIASRLDRALQAEKRAALEAAKGEAREAVAAYLNKAKFKVANLDDFAVGEEGITFYFDYGFPHAARADQPGGKFLIAYAELCRDLAPKSPLAPLCVAASPNAAP